MNDEPVLLESVDDDGLCTITLNRPSAMNALNGELVGQLWHAFYELAHDDAVRVVVLTAAGDRAFCAGADLEERQTMDDAEVRRRIADYRGCFGAIDDCPRPVICAINGYAFGGGLELAMACDLRVVDAGTEVGLTETRLGIIPGAGGTQRLPRIVGAAKAKELIFSAARLTGEQAEACGLVTDAVAGGEVVERAKQLGRGMLGSAPIALEQAKIAIDAGIQADLSTGLDIESRAYAVTLATDDRQEGLDAFREGRTPNFKGT